MSIPNKPRFTLIQGGGGVAPIEGPIARLGLRERVEPVPTKLWMFVIFAKGMLLASILYYFFA